MKKIEKLKNDIKNKVTDPRRTSYGNILHKLEDIMIIGLCSTICGGQDYADMEEFGKERYDFLRKFLELPNGIPSSDTFERLFERLCPEEVSECLINWLNIELPERCVVAIDGKTIKGSANDKHDAYHVVSAFVAEHQITLGEVTTEEKSNEITAVPQLLDLLVLDGAIVTADAMSCQHRIVTKIASMNADYVIGLKSNQPKLYEFANNKFEDRNNISAIFGTRERYRGKTVVRTYYLITDINDFENLEKWIGIKAVGMVKTTEIDGDTVTEHVRYFITSLTNIVEFAFAVRKHWSIENQLHWSLDVIYREDECHAKKDNSPLILNIFRKLSLSLLAKSKTKYSRLSKRKLQFKAALNPEFLLEILLGFSG